MALALLAGCAPVAAVLDPPLGQLARWEGAPDATVAAEPVACPQGHPACAALHARRGGACLALAMGARAPGAACPGSDAHLDCALAGLSASHALRPSPAAARGAAQAALCLGEWRNDAALAARAATLARDARDPLLAARAATLSARRTGDCETARAALPLAPPGSAEAADLHRLLTACGGAR